MDITQIVIILAVAIIAWLAVKFYEIKRMYPNNANRVFEAASFAVNAVQTMKAAGLFPADLEDKVKAYENAALDAAEKYLNGLGLVVDADLVLAAIRAAYWREFGRQ